MRQIHTLENLRSERVCQPAGLGGELHGTLYHAAEPPFNPSVQVGSEHAVNLSAPRPQLRKRQGRNAPAGKHE